MKTVVTASQMAEMDRYTIEDLKIPGVVLMENAGRGVVNVALSLLGDVRNKLVYVFCGPGNNGGDGYVVARHLLNMGAHVETFVLTSRDKIKGDALVNLIILEKMSHQIKFIDHLPATPQRLPDLIVDAMLGTGVKGALRGLFADMVEFINSLKVPVLAIDIPTGVDADSGAVDGLAIFATKTATMALLKRGLVFSPGREHAGEVEIIDISMPPQVVSLKHSNVRLVEGDDVSTLLPRRAPDTHKNKCGTVATVAGSRGFTGAAALASEAALRAGAGLSYLCVPLSLNEIFEVKSTEVITWPFDDAGMGYLHSGCFNELVKPLRDQNVVAIGPGIGQHKKTAELVHLLLQELDKPLVLDADGLNVCAQNTDLIKNYKGDMVLTPHPGELSRLIGMPNKEIVSNRIDVTRQVATEWQKVVVLKGGPTVIGFPDGEVFINSSGNAGMATAGSGDVLTGVIAGLMAQGLAAESAAVAGVYIHGLAGDLARDELGEMGLVAGDILRYVPGAIKRLQGI